MRRALLIGINDYPNGHALHGCIEDINNLAHSIERNGDGAKNFDVKKCPNLKNSDDAIKQIKQLFHDDAEVALFYFSGHGYIDADGGQLVFPDDILEPSRIKGIKMSELMDIVNQSRAKSKIVVLDCCHAGFIGKGSSTTPCSTLNTGVSILTACREDEYANELGGHGVFTELLCSALKGGAADFCGNITIGSIYSYIDRSLGAWDQRPIFKTNVTEFVPIKKVNPTIEMSEIRKLTELFSDANTHLSLDPSFEFTNSPDYKHEIVAPFASNDNVQIFKTLQKLQSIGFVEPVGEQHMYFAAMNSKGCRLTELGKYYWRLVRNNRL